jgi:hypothetical protein
MRCLHGRHGRRGKRRCGGSGGGDGSGPGGTGGGAGGGAGGGSGGGGEKKKSQNGWVGADSVTTYRGGAEGVGAGSMTPWTARQCQWVQEARDMEANAVQAAETEVAQ